MDDESQFLVQPEWPQDLMQQFVSKFFESSGSLDPKLAKRLSHEIRHLSRTISNEDRRFATVLQRGLQVTVTGLTIMGSVFGWRNVALLCLLISQEFTKFADEREGKKPH